MNLLNAVVARTRQYDKGLIASFAAFNSLFCAV
jgi:hypothetical protein